MFDKDQTITEHLSKKENAQFLDIFITKAYVSTRLVRMRLPALTHPCMWDSLRLVRERFSDIKWCSEVKRIQSELRTTFPRFLTHTYCGIANASLQQHFLLNLCLQRYILLFASPLPSQKFHKYSPKISFVSFLKGELWERLSGSTSEKQTLCSSGSNTSRTKSQEDQTKNYLPCLKGEIYFY